MVQFESDLWNRMVDKVCIDFTLRNMLGEKAMYGTRTINSKS